MKNFFQLIFLYAVFICAGYSQSSETQCDVSFLISLNERIDVLGDADVLQLINMADEVCENNVEFQEVYNELLFRITEKYPEEILSNLSGASLATRKLIMEHYSSPVSDDMDIDMVISKINSIAGFDSLREDIVKALENK